MIIKQKTSLTPLSKQEAEDLFIAQARWHEEPWTDYPQPEKYKDTAHAFRAGFISALDFKRLDSDLLKDQLDQIRLTAQSMMETVRDHFRYLEDRLKE